MSHTLILNADASPISVVPVSSVPYHKAIKKMFLETVDVLAEYEHWRVRSPSITMHVPSVVMLKEFYKFPLNVKFLRYNVCLRDDFTCQYCGDNFVNAINELTMDHVVPESLGGKRNWENIVSACETCNAAKADKTYVTPNTLPYKPTYWELVNKRKNYPLIVPHHSWADYLGWPEDKIIVREIKRN